MEAVNMLVNAVVMVAIGAVLAYLLQDQRKIFERRMDGLEGRVDRHEEATQRRFDQMENRLLRIESEIGAVRSDLTHVALAVGVRREPGAS